MIGAFLDSVKHLSRGRGRLADDQFVATGGCPQRHEIVCYYRLSHA
jgi:hypothetical protein